MHIDADNAIPIHIDKYFIFKFDIIVFCWRGHSFPPLGLKRIDYQEQTQKLIEIEVFWSKDSILASYDPILYYTCNKCRIYHPLKPIPASLVYGEFSKH